MLLVIINFVLVNKYSATVDGAKQSWNYKNLQSFRRANPRKSMHAEGLPWSICVPSLLLIAKAVFLL